MAVQWFGRGGIALAKVVAILSTFCLACLLIAGVAYMRFAVPGGALFRQQLDAPSLVKEVRQLNQLVTVKYSIQKVVGWTEARPLFGSESILLLVEARVLAGVSLADLTQFDVTMPNRNEAHILLRPAQIIETFLEENNTKVWDRRVTWWTPWVSPDKDLEHRARLAAIEQVRESAIAMGILKDAQRNAEQDIRQILLAFGISKVVFLKAST